MAEPVVLDPAERERLRAALGIPELLAAAATNVHVRRYRASTTGMLMAHLSMVHASGMVDTPSVVDRRPAVARRTGVDAMMIRTDDGSGTHLFRGIGWHESRTWSRIVAQPYRTLVGRRYVVVSSFLPEDGACPLSEVALGEYRRAVEGLGLVRRLTRKEKRNLRRKKQRERARG